METPYAPPQQVFYEAKPVPDSLKDSLLDWIEGLNILRRGSLDKELLPSICRTGVLFCDILNRLQGKSAVLRGFERTPKNRTHAHNNMNKVLEYLRSFPKVPSRYLWSCKELLEGSENVVWGLLEDIRAHFSIRTVKPRATSRPPVSSPVPPAPRPPLTPKTARPRVSPCLTESIKLRLSVPFEFLQQKSETLRGYANRPRTPLNRPPSASSVKSLASESHKELPVSQELKDEVTEWLHALDIEFTTSDSALEDTLQNGTLLAEVVKVLEGVRVKVNPHPKHAKTAQENFFRALDVLKKKKSAVTTQFFSESERLAKDLECVWRLLQHLKYSYPRAVPLAYQPSLLPYGALQIKQVEQQILDWLATLKILNPLNRPFFHELLPEMKSGLLLCELVSRTVKVRVTNVVLRPTTEQAALNNIRKALDVLRKVPRMPQKFTWKEREILRGNSSVVLGLLEDLMQFSTTPYEAPMKEPREWLGELGVAVPQTLDFASAFLPEFSTGVLLCEIVSKTEKTLIPGVDKDPRSRNSAIENIKKALAVLANKPAFPHKLLQCEEKVLGGDRDTILALLNTTRSSNVSYTLKCLRLPSVVSSASRDRTVAQDSRVFLSPFLIFNAIFPRSSRTLHISVDFCGEKVKFSGLNFCTIL